MAQDSGGSGSGPVTSFGSETKASGSRFMHWVREKPWHAIVAVIVALITLYFTWKIYQQTVANNAANAAAAGSGTAQDPNAGTTGIAAPASYSYPPYSIGGTANPTGISNDFASLASALQSASTAATAAENDVLGLGTGAPVSGTPAPTTPSTPSSPSTPVAPSATPWYANLLHSLNNPNDTAISDPGNAASTGYITVGEIGVGGAPGGNTGRTLSQLASFFHLSGGAADLQYNPHNAGLPNLSNPNAVLAPGTEVWITRSTIQSQ